MSPAIRRRTPAAVLDRGLALLSVAHGLILAAAAAAAPRLGLDGLWFAGTAVAMASNLGLLWLFRPRLLAGDNLHAVWGVANVLTATRGVLGTLLAGFLVSAAGPGSWAPAVLYTVLVCLDYVDGGLARATRTQTHMGAILDQEYDAFGILVAVLGLSLDRLGDAVLGERAGGDGLRADRAGGDAGVCDVLAGTSDLMGGAR